MNSDKAILAERAVIGSLLVSKDAIEDVEGEIIEEDFYDSFCRRVFMAIISMRRNDRCQVIDVITVSDKMRAMGKYGGNDVFVDLVEIANSVFAPSNVKAYAEIVKKESNKRKTAILINEANQKIANDDEGYLDFMRQGLTKIENNIPFIITSYSDVMEKTVQKLDEDSNSKRDITGLSTGFTEIDFYTNGLQNGDLIILAARPSMGKTMLMLNIADNISCIKQNEPVVLFSLEMPANQIVKRTLSRVSRIKGDLIFKAKFDGDEWSYIGKAVEELKHSKLFINDSSRMSAYQMRSYCRKIRNDHGLKAIFIDYIGLMDGEGENETLRLGNISRELKAIAKDFDVPVFVLCQLNRKIEERKERTPMLSDIRQSGNIEQDADLVMFLDRDKEIGKPATLTIAKHRNGRIGDIKLSLNLDNFEFINYSGF